MSAGDVIEHEDLKSITGIDCSTSSCRANAVGTGRLVRGLASSPSPSKWNVEIYCPDCGETYTRRSPLIQGLAAALLEPQSPERDARINSLLDEMRMTGKGA